jgi:predicted nucleic acid-binding protein
MHASAFGTCGCSKLCDAGADVNARIGLSVMTIVELTQGVQRAGTDKRRERRQAFVDELIRDVPVCPVRLEVARLARRIEGDQAVHGMTIAFEDLRIAAPELLNVSYLRSISST